MERVCRGESSVHHVNPLAVTNLWGRLHSYWSSLQGFDYFSYQELNTKIFNDLFIL